MYSNIKLSQYYTGTPQAIRPSTFAVNYNHPLAQDLVFAGLGAHAGGNYYYDSSLFANTGTLANGVTHDVFSGQKALAFASDHSSVSLANTITLSSNWTIAKWGYPTTAATAVVYGDNSDTNNHFYIDDGTRARFRNSAGDLVNWTGDTSFQNIKRHYALVGYSTTADLFLDGVSQTAQAITPSLSLVNLGNGYTTTQYEYQGYLWDFLVYDRALTASEIRQLADPSNVMLSGMLQPARCKSLSISFANIDFNLNGEVLYVEEDAEITSSGDFRFYDWENDSYDMEDATLVVDGDLTFTGDSNNQLVLTNINSENDAGVATYCTVTNCENTGTDIDATSDTNVDGGGNTGWDFGIVDAVVAGIRSTFGIFKSLIFNSLLHNR